MAEFNMAAIIMLIQNEWVKFIFVKNEWIQDGCQSSSWVRMNDFESDWISWSQSFEENGRIQDERIQDGRIQDGNHHQVKWEWMSLSQNEIVWVRVRVERECFWVNLREDNKVSESKMAVSESNMAEFKMAAIIKLSQNEWVKFFFVQNGWIQYGTIQDGCHHLVNQIALVWVRVRVEGECFWVNLREDNKMFESKMAVSESN